MHYLPWAMFGFAFALDGLVARVGLMRWAAYGQSSTMLDLRDYSVVRKGACFDLITDLLQRHYGITLSEKPG